ncbi:O-antigen ligase family protein [Massilia sp. WG5]|uniref:O-antigen ligase family protein n=1 Tax=Massilia sp. WG5 TaxID=1707785 RepID=UPI000A40F42B|nr:O-antigen ligase family protein [Massilia sp. WG5]
MQAIGIATNRPVIGISQKFTVHAAFLLLYPGFFFYQTLLGLGIIGAYLGGYFTLVALLLLPPLALTFIAAVKRNKDYLSGMDVWIAIFVFYYFSILAVNLFAGADPIIVERYTQSMIFCFETYVIFRIIDLENKRLIWITALSLLVMSVITYYFSIGGFFFLQALGEAKDPDNLATYQGFARSYIYTYIVMIAVTRRMATRYLSYAIGACALFLNGARSEFSAVLFLIPVVELYYAKHRLYAISVLVFIVGLAAGGIEQITSMLPDNRILQLLDLSHSTSAVAREHLSQNAIRTISENPIFGDFASYPDGHYAHNVLCAWVDFGLFGVVFFLSLLLAHAAWLFFNGFFAKARSPYFVLAWSFICITILWALTAKNMPDMSVGAAMGAFARYGYRKKCRLER